MKQLDKMIFKASPSNKNHILPKFIGQTPISDMMLEEPM